MEVLSSLDAANIAKDWATEQYGVEREGVNVISSRKMRDGSWSVRLSFPKDHHELFYSVVISDYGTIIDFHRGSDGYASSASLRSASTLTLISLVIAIIAFIVFAATSISTIVLLAVQPGYGMLVSGIFFIPGAILLVFLFVDGYVIARILRLRRLIERGDADASYREDSIELGILAIVFGGIITGVLLLIVRGELRDVLSSGRQL